VPRIDPALLERPDVRAALASHHIGQVYRLLVGAGVSQRRIAALTGTSQSQVRDRPRPAGALDMGARADLRRAGVGRGVMGLSYGPQGAYGETVTDRHPAGEVDEDVRRRAFLQAAAAAVTGSPVLGDALALSEPPQRSTPLPSRLGPGDVTAVRDLTEQMRAVARQYGGQADTLGSIAARSTRLMRIPGADGVKRALGVALAELHTTAGWACYVADGALRVRAGRPGPRR
jgi:hypothetical protein